MSGDSERGLMTGNTNRLNRNTMEEEEVGGEDRISRLPESLIHHILSLLPTKCAVSTTVLSKGWKNLWISVPVLDFSEWKPSCTQETLSATKSFVDFMDRVLVLRKMSDIKKLCLTSCKGNYFDVQRVKSWITTAIKCRVEELIVCWDCPGKLKIFPGDLHTCDSLTLLVMDFSKYHPLHLPQSFSFPRLKILRLSRIMFCGEPMTQQLFSNCPVLEEFCLRDCFWGDSSFISPTLKSLTLVESLRDWNNIKIDAPNLMSITIAGELPRHLVVDSFPSLVDADIHRMCSVSNYWVDDVILKFVKKLSNVKHLKLSGVIVERLELANVLSASFPTFINLITLEAFFIKTQQVESLFAFLRFSPNLESLVFTGVYDDDGVYEDAWTLDVVPHCLLMHLKSVEFHYFTGNLMELDLVQLFLQNAGVLQTVIIGISSLLYHTTKDVENFSNKVMEQLVKCKWASTDCVIKFELSVPPLL